MRWMFRKHNYWGFGIRVYKETCDTLRNNAETARMLYREVPPSIENKIISSNIAYILLVFSFDSFIYFRRNKKISFSRMWPAQFGNKISEAQRRRKLVLFCISGEEKTSHFHWRYKSYLLFCCLFVCACDDIYDMLVSWPTKEECFHANIISSCIHSLPWCFLW